MGPDHLGYAVPSADLNASLSASRPLVGHIALALPVGGGDAQPDRLGHQPRYWFSHVISVGMRWDVDFGDLLDYLLRDRTPAPS
jgi:acetyltransferase